MVPGTKMGIGTGTLEAVLDRLVPADEFPGALGCGVAEIVRERIAEFETLLTGLGAFEALGPEAQDAALRRLEAEGDPSFAALVDLVHASYYADPRSWQAIGYTTHIPGRP